MASGGHCRLRPGSTEPVRRFRRSLRRRPKHRSRRWGILNTVTERIIDSDQHLYESRSMWADHIDPARRDEALRLEDDPLGYTWLTWRNERLELADVHQPGDTDPCGQPRPRLRDGERSGYAYHES